MSALLLSALAAGSSGQGALYVDDVFSTYLYTGNGSTQTINNGIDLAGKGGLVWQKLRSGSPGGGVLNSNLLWDTIRGVSSGYLKTDTTQGAGGAFWLTSFNSNGFSFADTYATAGANYVSWTFRKAPKFFDVVTYTGNGVAGRQIAHGLGVAPGLIIAKCTDAASNWGVWHIGNGSADYSGFSLNTANAAYYAGFSPGSHTATYFKPYDIADAGASFPFNNSGATYVAYLFAHDPSADGIVQCGSFTTDASGAATVNLGWANGSQFAMIKAASTTGDWEMYDTARTSAWSGNDARLRANLSSAEDFVARISASGTSITFAGLTANSTYIYMAIRSPS